MNTADVFDNVLTAFAAMMALFAAFGWSGASAGSRKGSRGRLPVAVERTLFVLEVLALLAIATLLALELLHPAYDARWLARFALYLVALFSMLGTVLDTVDFL